eukprot:3296895-Amphidinium_carterae.1
MQTLAKEELVQAPQSRTHVDALPPGSFAEQMRTLSSRDRPLAKSPGAGVYPTPDNDIRTEMDLDEETPVLGECTQVRARSRERRQPIEGRERPDDNERGRSRSRTVDVVEPAQG